ncbi:MAG: DUF192 domain-containing protein [Vampirovibrionales bacterium]|nr:DUF192 domain-containing protein [Vampirovibrionales bacterium]
MPKHYKLWFNGRCVADAVKGANWFWPRLVGLMGQKRLLAGQGLWLKGCKQVHTCFMRFAIDVVFLDENAEVLQIVPAMAPWKLSPYLGKAKSILELPAGEAEAAGIKQQDVLKLEAA